MMSHQPIMRVKFFVRSNLKHFIILPPHDEDLVGDTLTTLTLNYRWRHFIVAYLEKLYDYNRDNNSEVVWQVIEMKLLDMIDDLYD